MLRDDLETQHFRAKCYADPSAFKYQIIAQEEKGKEELEDEVHADCEAGKLEISIRICKAVQRAIISFSLSLQLDFTKPLPTI